MNPASTKILVVAVSVLSIAAAFQTYTTRSVCPQPDAYGFARAKQRIGSAADAIPASAVVGYVSDLPIAEHAGGVALQSVQYALAPRMVVDLKEHPKARWVIGNFNQPGDFAKAGAERGLRVVQDLGNGIVLYEAAR